MTWGATQAVAIRCSGWPGRTRLYLIAWQRVAGLRWAGLGGSAGRPARRRWWRRAGRRVCGRVPCRDGDGPAVRPCGRAGPAGAPHRGHRARCRLVSRTCPMLPACRRWPRSRAAWRTQDVLDGRSELGVPDGDPGLLLDVEPGLTDSRTGIAAQWQPRANSGTACCPGAVPDGPARAGRRRNARSTTAGRRGAARGRFHRARLLIGHRAQHQTGDHGVVVTVLAGQVPGRAGHDLDPGACLPGNAAGPVTPPSARLDRGEAAHTGRVVREVLARPAPTSKTRP